MSLLVLSGQSTETAGTQQSAYRWLLSFVYPQRRSVLGLLCLSLFASSLVLLQPYLIKLVIDEGIIAKDFEKLLTYATAIFILAFSSMLCSGVSRYWHTQLSAKILFDLREYVYQHLQTLSPSFYARRSTGAILSRLDGDVAEIQRFALDGLFSLVSNVVGLIGSVSLLFWLNAPLALVALLIIPLQWVWLAHMRPKVEAGTRKVREGAADISSFLVETLPAMKFIQTVSAQKQEHHRLNQFNASYLDKLLNLQITEFYTQATPSLLTSLCRGGIFIIGGYWVIQGQMALGSLIAFSTYLAMAVGPVNSLLGLYVAFGRARVSLERVRELTEASADVALSPGQALVPDNLQGHIRLENVSFSYPNKQENIFENISVEFPAGKKIAVTGPSGIGKTTLIDLLLRHYDPSRGSIYVDGYDLKNLDLAEWRKKIAVVTQDITLFRGTLADNLRYVNKSADDESLLNVLKQAQLEDWLNSLPEGLNTNISERGMNLSGGQRQRIALARALLQDPVMVILDEATSAVDSAIEDQLTLLIDDVFASRTRLVVSHRETPLKNADYLLALAEGEITLQKYDG